MSNKIIDSHHVVSVEQGHDLFSIEDRSHNELAKIVEKHNITEQAHTSFNEKKQPIDLLKYNKLATRNLLPQESKGAHKEIKQTYTTQHQSEESIGEKTSAVVEGPEQQKHTEINEQAEMREAASTAVEAVAEKGMKKDVQTTNEHKRYGNQNANIMPNRIRTAETHHVDQEKLFFATGPQSNNELASKLKDAALNAQIDLARKSSSADADMPQPEVKQDPIDQSEIERKFLFKSTSHNRTKRSDISDVEDALSAGESVAGRVVMVKQTEIDAKGKAQAPIVGTKEITDIAPASTTHPIVDSKKDDTTGKAQAPIVGTKEITDIAPVSTTHLIVDSKKDDTTGKAQAPIVGTKEITDIATVPRPLVVAGENRDTTTPKVQSLKTAATTASTEEIYSPAKDEQGISGQRLDKKEIDHKFAEDNMALSTPQGVFFRYGNERENFGLHDQLQQDNRGNEHKESHQQEQQHKKKQEAELEMQGEQQKAKEKLATQNQFSEINYQFKHVDDNNEKKHTVRIKRGADDKILLEPSSLEVEEKLQQALANTKTKFNWRVTDYTANNDPVLKSKK